ncbi:hypothetical protein [Gemmata palustris]|uniref:hypothetical protein n=1 Tax=Gemmata palustris TaxID=2822762 RepID=UPI0036F290E5
MLALDDTPTERYGPKVRGAGAHHNPTPGPAGARSCTGTWVVLGLLVGHPLGGLWPSPVGPPVHPPQRSQGHPGPDRPEFATKLVMAVDLVRWAHGWLKTWGRAVWVVADGAHAKAPVLKALLALRVTMVSRLRKDAALWTVPPARDPSARGRPRVYGEQRVSLAKRARTRAGGPRARSPCMGSPWRSGTRRSRPRGGRPGARSGSSWWTNPRGGSRSSARTPRPPWPTSWA